jgi:hypothetical protein
MPLGRPMSLQATLSSMRLRYAKWGCITFDGRGECRSTTSRSATPAAREHGEDPVIHREPLGGLAEARSQHKYRQVAAEVHPIADPGDLSGPRPQVVTRTAVA